MIEKFRFLVGLLVFVTGSIVTLAASPVSPVRAAPDDTAALYKIIPVESELTPAGCIGCSPQKINVPTFTEQGSTENPIGFASKIDTFTTSTWNQMSNLNETIEGYCSITFTNLKCLGDNRYGQLGGESYVNSLSVPVEAKDKGIVINGVTDVSSNGLTTCIVASGALKCVGQGAWDGNYYKTYWTTDTTDTIVYVCNPTCSEKSSNSITTTTNTYKIYDSSDTLIETRIETNQGCCSENPSSKVWKTFTAFENNVVKVKVGNANGSTPTICVLLLDGTTKCSFVAQLKYESFDDDVTRIQIQEADCDSLFTGITSRYEKPSAWCSTSELNGNDSYDRHFSSTSGRKILPTTWAWVDAGVTGVVDMSMTDEYGGGSTVCLAGATTVCSKFSAGEFGPKKVIENGENSEAVFTPGYNPGSVCIYSKNTVSCGAGSWSQSGHVLAQKVTPIAAMAKPMNIFIGWTPSMQKLYFLLPTGILAADAWILSCSNCQTQSNVVSPVTAFQSSTPLQYTHATAINGSTDSMDYIPMSVSSGVRNTRSAVELSIKTASGQTMSGLSIRWTAPDMPGTLSSSSTSTLATDNSGLARTSVITGPVTFTLSPPAITQPCLQSSCLVQASPAATVASGASLQAASLTVVVGDSGGVNITIPDPPEVVSRKISVTLPDGSAVPSAMVQLKNNYITYAYQNSGTGTSTWSSRPKDARGYLGQIGCAYCFVTPPKYVTGADGSVTFPSFDPSNRSSTFDADISYDDGELNQTVKRNFTSLNEVVPMPFMASIKAVLPDADPATPEKEVDADPATPEIDIKADESGAVTIESELLDEDKVPIEGLTETVETVNAGCDQGGLVSPTARADTVCREGTVSTSSINKSEILRAFGVRTTATCSAQLTAKSGSDGKAKLVICAPYASTKYRIRGSGALATKSFCVRVNNLPCTVSSSSVNTNTTVVNTNVTFTNTNTTNWIGTDLRTSTGASKVPTVRKGKTLAFSKFSQMAGYSVPKDAKVSIKIASQSRTYCAAVGTKVKGLKPGNCKVAVVVKQYSPSIKGFRIANFAIKMKVTK
jgi:hypothetical protein